MGFTKIIIKTVLCGVIFLSLNSFSATIYVSTTGSDSLGNGNLSNPYQTISNALNQSSNGDTIVIGGIYEKDKNRSVSGVPVLSRIPLLGWLFKNSQTTVSKQEMIVFITPFIVNSNGEK